MIHWPQLLYAVAMVESGNNPQAYNPSEQAVGIMQIRRLAVEDLNKEYGKSYSLADFHSAALSRWAFLQYGMMYGAKTEEEYCRIWNGGPDGMEKTSTEPYWKKVKSIYDKMTKEKVCRSRTEPQ